MNTQPPSIGRIVALHPRVGDVEAEPRAAIIIAVKPNSDLDEVTLRVFSPIGDTQVDAAWSEDDDPGCWNWLPRVDARSLRIPDKETIDETAVSPP